MQSSYTGIYVKADLKDNRPANVRRYEGSIGDSARGGRLEHVSEMYETHRHHLRAVSHSIDIPFIIHGTTAGPEALARFASASHAFAKVPPPVVQVAPALA
jgi:hypothetical protein